MKIIGDTKDYYDAGLSLGIDESIKWIRTPSVIIHRNGQDKALTPLKDRVMRLRWKHPRNLWNTNEVIRKTINYKILDFPLYFVGKRYQGIRVVEVAADYSTRTPYYFWDAESFKEYALSKKLDYVLESPSLKKYKDYVNDFNMLKSIFEFQSKEATDYCYANRIAIACLFHLRQEISIKERKFFPEVSIYDYQVPVIPNVAGQDRYSGWQTNCNLKDLHFYKKMDVYTAWQELSMFHANLPAEGNPMVNITDNKVKIAKAGFDNKTSFRHPVKIPHRKKKETVKDNK